MTRKEGVLRGVLDFHLKAMDKIKEVREFRKLTLQKLDKLRIEADGNLSRAEKAESALKDLQSQVLKLETENHNLSNKVVLLQGDVDRAEKRVEEVGYLLFMLD